MPAGSLPYMAVDSGGIHVVLVDANVLSSRILRDWLLQLCLTTGGRMFEVKWTEDIMAEVVRSIRRRKPDISGGYISDVRAKIENVLPDGKVTQYVVSGTYQGSDPHDAHVHAAAEACGADILVTDNVKDFRQSGVDDVLPYEVYTADEFFVLVDDSAPQAVRAVTYDQVRYYYNKNGSADLRQQLIDANAPMFAGRVRQRIHELCEEIEKLGPSQA